MYTLLSVHEFGVGFFQFSCIFSIGHTFSKLSDWKKASLRDVLGFVSCRLDGRDIYLPANIINMLELIALTVKFAEEIVPPSEILDGARISHMRFLYARYSRSLGAINDLSSAKATASRERRTRSSRRRSATLGSWTTPSLGMCHVDRSTISRCLQSARKDIMQQLVPA